MVNAASWIKHGERRRNSPYVVIRPRRGTPSGSASGLCRSEGRGNFFGPLFRSAAAPSRHARIPWQGQCRQEGRPVARGTVLARYLAGRMVPSLIQYPRAVPHMPQAVWSLGLLIPQRAQTQLTVAFHMACSPRRPSARPVRLTVTAPSSQGTAFQDSSPETPRPFGRGMPVPPREGMAALR